MIFFDLLKLIKAEHFSRKVSKTRYLLFKIKIRQRALLYITAFEGINLSEVWIEGKIETWLFNIIWDIIRLKNVKHCLEKITLTSIDYKQLNLIKQICKEWKKIKWFRDDNIKRHNSFSDNNSEDNYNSSDSDSESDSSYSNSSSKS